MWCLLLSIVFACTRPLMHHFLPLPSSFYLDEEVAGDEEGIDDDNIDNAAKDIATAPTDNIDYATMLPKVKSIPAKAATKKESAAAAAMPPPQPPPSPLPPSPPPPTQPPSPSMHRTHSLPITMPTDSMTTPT